MDVALDRPAVLVRGVAEGDVDGAVGLLGLRDLVGDPRGPVQPDPDLTDVVRIADGGHDLAQARRRCPAAPDVDRATAADLDPDRLVQGAQIGRDPLPDDDPLGRAFKRWQGDLAARQRGHFARREADPRPPRDRLAPGHRRPQVRAGGRRHPDLARTSPERGQHLRLLADREEIRGHRSVPPGIGAMRGVEVATHAGPLGDRLGGRVVQGCAGRTQDHVGRAHRLGGGWRRLGTAAGERLDRDDVRRGAEVQRGGGEGIRDLAVGPGIDDDREPLAHADPQVIARDPPCGRLDGVDVDRHRPASGWSMSISFQRRQTSAASARSCCS